MTKTIHGKVFGRTIEVDEDLGVSDGQEVALEVKVISHTAQKSGEGFLRTEGALVDDEEWDGIMNEIYQARNHERQSAAPELGEA
jgi:hypothetical protein